MKYKNLEENTEVELETRDMKQEFKDAIKHLRTIWPLVKWKMNSSEECCDINGHFSKPISLKIRIQPNGCMAELNASWGVGGLTLARSENKQGISWKEAIDQVMLAIKELAESLLPAEPKTIFHLCYREYYKGFNLEDVWGSYLSQKDAIAAAVKETKQKGMSDNNCWAFVVYADTLYQSDQVTDFCLVDKPLRAVIQMDGTVLYEHGVTKVDDETSILPEYAKTPPS